MCNGYPYIEVVELYAGPFDGLKLAVAPVHERIVVLDERSRKQGKHLPIYRRQPPGVYCFSGYATKDDCDWREIHGGKP